MNFPTLKSIIAGLDSRDLRKEVEVGFSKFGETGYVKLFELVAEDGLKPRQIANGLMLLFRTRGFGDTIDLFRLAVRLLRHESRTVRSSASRVVVALLHTSASPPDIEMDERADAKERLKAANELGIDSNSKQIVEAFLNGTLAW